jgi:hypothetical protein
MRDVEEARMTSIDGLIEEGEALRSMSGGAPGSGDDSALVAERVAIDREPVPRRSACVERSGPAR